MLCLKVGIGADVAGVEIGHRLCRPEGHVTGLIRHGHIRQLQEVIEHDGGFCKTDGLAGGEEDAPVLPGAALHHAAHQGGGDVGLEPLSDVRIVKEAGFGDALQRLHPRQGCAHGEKFPACDLGVRLETVGAAQLTSCEDPGLCQPVSRIAAGVPLHIRIADLAALLFDADAHRGRSGNVAPGVIGGIGEAVPAPLAAVGGIDEAAAVHLHLALGRLTAEAEGEQVALRVHRLKAAAHGNLPVGGQLQVFRNGRQIAAAILGRRNADGLHLHGVCPGKEQKTKRKRDYGSAFHKQSLL